MENEKMQLDMETRACVPVLIQKNIWKWLIIIGCIVPPALMVLLSDKSGSMPNSVAIFFLVPMTISLILLPFTGLIRKLIYAIPLPIILLFVFWPLVIYWIYEKFQNPQADLRKLWIFSILLWVFDLFFGWMLIAISALVLFLSIVGINR